MSSVYYLPTREVKSSKILRGKRFAGVSARDVRAIRKNLTECWVADNTSSTPGSCPQTDVLTP